MKKDSESLMELLQPGDFIIVDRGFRNSLDLIESLLLKSKMPHYLEKGKKQHSTEEANQSRLITSLRYLYKNN